MKINTFIEKEDGSAEFTAVLSQNQLHFIVDYGINMLIQQGIMVVEANKLHMVDGPEELQ